ncbi:DUF455 family protein [Ilumatobacter coccineus]|jgi:uncharacterized ferritin-like protein (DUF455 family)|uniref:DUF455 domain-containing protein n=1 Tax=Ilumatobacter coccineus (strain NBRC 103263 / KCTC 29153 / YM16-304) TaxID=1313172 RepID=A0A6C7E155_ILUCY|nr:DUF455 family protein [Ilumatobacter coccineus]BAN00700.1 hypothetical protein YM304_03860 [Ilumatobacter coccineus YM16-304]
MRQFLPVEDLARDERFVQTNMAARLADKRSAIPVADKGDAPARKSSKSRGSNNRLTPDRHDASDAARGLMHGIMVGEIQALEGAGRTAHDFEAGDGSGDTIPFELKLDMARQAWDEARHVEISAKLSDWMGTELGEFQENTVLFEAACSNDPVLRLAGVNRALEGLAIDVFTQMKEFGQLADDPFLEFCEDWMLADEVTHVKMGSDWLRKVTENDPDRRTKALEFQQVVDKLFSFGGARSDSDESSFQLARRFRELAGFTDDEVATIAEMDLMALEERKAAVRAMQETASLDSTPA